MALVGAKHIIDVLPLTKNAESAITRSSSINHDLSGTFYQIVKLSFANFPRDLLRPRSSLNGCSVASTGLKTSKTDLDIAFNDSVFEDRIRRKRETISMVLRHEFSLGRRRAVVVFNDCNCRPTIAEECCSRKNVVRTSD